MDVSAQIEAHKSKFKSTDVSKSVPVDFDLSLLAAFDPNAIDETRLRYNTEEYLKEYTRDGTQLLINQIFTLPVVNSDAGVMAQLPTRITIVPREKPLPKPRLMTRWEKFAKIKGIQKRKKERMVFDEATGEYVPSWGYGGEKRKNQMEDWLIPIKDNSDPNVDQYLERKEEKKERIAKNERRHRRNLEEAIATNTNSNGLPNLRSLKKRQLQDQLVMSKAATASMGKFDKRLEGEPKQKGIKRKFEPNIADLSKEKQSSLNIIAKMNKGGDAINVRKAIKISKHT